MKIVKDTTKENAPMGLHVGINIDVMSAVNLVMAHIFVTKGSQMVHNMITQLNK